VRFAVLIAEAHASTERPTVGRQGEGADMMKRIVTAVVLAALAITLIVTFVQPAQATHTLAHLRRQIARLENQVSSLQQQVNSLKGSVSGLNREVFNCEVFDTVTPHTFPDGTIGYPLYERSTCAA
jgi:cell division protein FtsB